MGTAGSQQRSRASARQYGMSTHARRSLMNASGSGRHRQNAREWLASGRSSWRCELVSCQSVNPSDSPPTTQSRDRRVSCLLHVRPIPASGGCPACYMPVQTYVTEDPMLSHKPSSGSVTIVPMLLHSLRDAKQTNRLTPVRGLAKANCPKLGLRNIAQVGCSRWQHPHCAARRGVATPVTRGAPCGATAP